MYLLYTFRLASNFSWKAEDLVYYVSAYVGGGTTTKLGLNEAHVICLQQANIWILTFRVLHYLIVYNSQYFVVIMCWCENYLSVNFVIFGASEQENKIYTYSHIRIIYTKSGELKKKSEKKNFHCEK